MGSIIFYPVTLTFMFGLFIENFNIADNFWIASAHKINNVDSVTLTFEICLLFENFYFDNNFSTVLLMFLYFTWILIYIY